MASNVFGEPITEGSRPDRAREAKNNPNAGGKQDAAIAYVRQFGTGVATLGIFYNATGEPLFVSKNNSFYGKVLDSYPPEVQNGQWGAFLHVSKKEKKEEIPSMGYVVYKVKAIDNEDVWPLMGWENRNDVMPDHTRSFCDVYDDDEKIVPDVIYLKIQASVTTCTCQKYGIWMSTTIGNDTSPLFKAYFNLE